MFCGGGNLRCGRITVCWDFFRTFVTMIQCLQANPGRTDMFAFVLDAESATFLREIAGCSHVATLSLGSGQVITTAQHGTERLR